MLRVSLIGNMGGEPDMRYSSRGTQIVTISVAVNQVRTGPDGERQENTEWFRVKVGQPKMSEFAQRLTKGTRVLAIGRLDIGHYQARTGELRTSFDVWADELQVLSPRPGGPAEPFQAAGEPDADRDRDSDGEPAAAGVSSVPRRAAPARSPTNGRTAVAEEDTGEELPF